jgi:hypothetical protein
VNRFRLSERWAFDAADPILVRTLLDTLRGEPIVRADLAGAFGGVMSGIDAFALHTVHPMLVQSEPRGCVRTSALLSLGLKQHIANRPGPRAARAVLALAMARCLPFYFVLRMLRSLDTDDALKVEFFRAELDEYTRSSVALGRPFLRELNGSVRAPFERYRSLVRLTCRAYEALYGLSGSGSAGAVQELVEQDRQAVFMVHFPLAVDLHHLFETTLRRPRRLSLRGMLRELDAARSFDGLLSAGGG